MSQAPVSNCASHGILPENSTQAMEISQFAYETSLAWGRAGNRRPKKEEIPGADEERHLLLFVNSRWQLS